MLYVRTVRTTSGAKAVSIVWSSRCMSHDIQHIGSAHDDAWLAILIWGMVASRENGHAYTPRPCTKAVARGGDTTGLWLAKDRYLRLIPTCAWLRPYFRSELLKAAAKQRLGTVSLTWAGMPLWRMGRCGSLQRGCLWATGQVSKVSPAESS